MQVHTNGKYWKAKYSLESTQWNRCEMYESHGLEARNIYEVRKADHTKLLHTNTKRRHMMHSYREKTFRIANWYLYDEKYNTFSSTHTIHAGKVTHLATPKL
jgi:hypothetical protein